MNPKRFSDILAALTMALVAMSALRVASADATDPDIEIVPPKIIVDFGTSESGPFDLLLRNEGSESAKLEVILGALINSTNQRLGELSFVTDDAGPTIDRRGVTLSPKQRARLKVRATGVASHGLYKAKIRVVDPASGKELKEAEVEVRKEKRSLKLSIVGHSAGQPYELLPKHTEERRFPIIVKNDGDALTSLAVDAVKFAGAAGDISASLEPNSFDLESGQQRALTLALDEAAQLPIGGSMRATLQFKDRNTEGEAREPLRQIFSLLLKPISLGLTIDKPDPAKPLEFTVTGVDRKTFVLGLKKPADTPDLTVSLEGQVTLRDGTRASLTSADDLVLKDSEWHVVSVTFDLEQMPAAGTHQGLLEIKDAAGTGLRQSVPFILKGSYASDAPVWGLIVAISTGSILSYILYIFLPRSIRRTKVRDKLNALKAQVDDLAQFDLSHAGQAALTLQNKVEVDRARLRLSFELARPWYPYYSDRMTEIEAVLEEQKANIDRLKTIGHLRQRIWTESSIPFGLRDEFESALRSAEWGLVEGDPDVVQAKLDALRARLSGGDLHAAHGTELAKRIAERLNPAGPAGTPNNVGFIDELTDELRKLVAAGPIAEDRVEEIGRKFAVVETYYYDYRTLKQSGQPVSGEDDERIEKLLRGGIRAGVQIREARSLIGSLQRGVTLDEIIRQFEDKNGRIELSNQKPAPGEELWARWRFSDRTINAECELTAGLMFLWDFGDQTRLGRGMSCAHFFSESNADKPFKVTLRVRQPNGDDLELKPERSITVQKKPTRPTDSSILEAAGFLIALSIAILVGIETQFTAFDAAPEAPETLFATIRTYLPAFLWGFALDQAKGGFLSAYTNLSGNQQGGGKQN